MGLDEKSDMVYELLDLLKKNKLNDSQKNTILNIVKGLTNRTENQKERFFRFYNLLEGENKNYRLCDMALFYNCTPGCIRVSVGRIRNSLINSNEETITMLKNIWEEYHNQN